MWTPAPSTAVCAVALAECIADADLPPGVFNLVTGPGPLVGDEIARNPGTDGVAFIGSTATGRIVAQAAAGKAALLEMGGNGPVVVMDDADLDAAVDATVTACYLCAGQSCTAGERILVHRAVRDEYVELLARRVTERVLLGDPFDDATTMGPVNNEPVAVKMDEHVGDAVSRGASVVSGGARAGGFATSLYWQPTILTDVPADARVAVEGETSVRSLPSSRSTRSRGDRAGEGDRARYWSAARSAREPTTTSSRRRPGYLASGNDNYFEGLRAVSVHGRAGRRAGSAVGGSRT